MSLIETYASEVGRHLPRKNRADIEAEICSAIQDLLEERSREMGKPMDAELIFEVLKQYGDPEKVAASYQDERYLIGPDLYPVFLTVLRIVFPVVAILAGLGAIVNGSQHVGSVENLSATFVSVLIGVVTAAITALGNLVLIFGIIEWVVRSQGLTPKGKLHPSGKAWDPRTLTRVASTNQVKSAEVIVEIVACFAAIVLFNFYPQIFRFGFNASGDWYLGASNLTSIPLLSRVFFSYIPYLTIIWTLTIILDILLLRLGNWNTVTRISSIGLKVVGILVAGSLLVQPSLVGLSASSLALSVENADLMIFSLNQLVRLVLLLAILISGFDILRAVIRVLHPETSRLPTG